MRELFPVLLLSLPLFVGCSHTLHVPRDPAAPEFVQAAKAIEGRTATITTLDETEIVLDSVFPRADTICGSLHGTQDRRVMPLKSIAEVVVFDRERGTWQGLLIGGVVGAVVALSATSSSEPAETPNPNLTQAISGQPPMVAEMVAMAATSTSSEESSFDRSSIVALTAVGCALCGGAIGRDNPPSTHYDFNEKPAVSDAGTKANIITLVLRSFVDENDSSVCVVWNGRRAWLPRRRIAISEIDELIYVKVPESLLESAARDSVCN